jgi:hypothetical protein
MRRVTAVLLLLSVLVGRSHATNSYQERDVTGVHSLHIEPSAGWLPKLWIDGKNAGPLHGDGAAYARALANHLAGIPGGTIDIRIAGHTTEAGYFIDRLSLLRDMANSDEIFRGIQAARAAHQRNYTGTLNGVQSIHVEPRGQGTLPSLFVNGRAYGPLSNGGQASALGAYFLKQEGRAASLKFSGYFTESGFYVSSLELLNDRSNLAEISKGIAQASQSGQRYYEGLVKGVQSIYIESRGAGQLPTLYIHHRQLGTLHGSGPAQAAALEKLLQGLKGQQASVELRAHFTESGFYIDSLTTKELSPVQP